MINSITYNTSIKYNKKSQNNENVNNEIKALELQKSQIEKEIERIKSNTKTTQKIKDDLIKPLQKQIDEIESEVQQKQMENVEKSYNKDEKVNKNTNITDSKDIKEKNDSAKNYLLLDNSAAYNRIKKIGAIKASLKGSSAVLQKEADIDEDRGNTKAAARKRTYASKNDVNTNMLNLKIYSQSSKITKNISKADDLADKNASIDTLS
jgi:chromosome segregation ATPase